MTEHNNRETILNIVRTFTGQSNVLTIPKVFIKFTGSIESALLLSQIIYWSDRTPPERNGWFYKTSKEWANELCLSRHKINKATQNLVQKKLIKTQLKKASGSPTLHYLFEPEAFIHRFSVFLKMDLLNFSKSSYIRLQSESEHFHNLPTSELAEAQIKSELEQAGYVYSPSNPSRLRALP